MCRCFKNYLHVLNDPIIVSKIQTYFGVEPKVLTDNKPLRTDNLVNDDECLNDKYKINNKFYYTVFWFITHLGSEIFYIVFLPLLVWLYDEKIAYLTCISWGINMYIGQMTKELFKMQRPSTPPVIKLEKAYMDEFGFPSTHVMASMSISYTFLALVFREYELTLGFFNYATIFLICVLMSVSRVYLGMHSILDCVGGCVYSYMITTLFLGLTTYVENLLATGIEYGILFYGFGIFLCLLYPKSKRESSARVDTFIIIGVCSGICMGISLKHELNMDLSAFYVKLLDRDFYSLAVYRFAIGFILVFLTRQSCKTTIFYLALKIFRFRSIIEQNEKICAQNLVKKSFSFEFFYYFLTYSSVSFSVIFTTSWIFDILNMNWLFDLILCLLSCCEETLSRSYQLKTNPGLLFVFHHVYSSYTWHSAKSAFIRCSFCFLHYG
jgi:hypothetical protein